MKIAVGFAHFMKASLTLIGGQTFLPHGGIRVVHRDPAIGDNDIGTVGCGEIG